MQQEISPVSPFIRPMGNVLQLLRPQAADSGRYICVANNPLGEDRRDVSLARPLILFPEQRVGGKAIIPFNLRRARPSTNYSHSDDKFRPCQYFYFSFSTSFSSIIRKAPFVVAERDAKRFLPRRHPFLQPTFLLQPREKERAHCYSLLMPTLDKCIKS